MEFGKGHCNQKHKFVSILTLKNNFNEHLVYYCMQWINNRKKHYGASQGCLKIRH
jgi:hypothetical protein